MEWNDTEPARVLTLGGSGSELPPLACIEGAHSRARQRDAGAAVDGALEHAQPIDLSRSLLIAAFLADRVEDGIDVLAQREQA